MRKVLIVLMSATVMTGFAAMESMAGQQLCWQTGPSSYIKASVSNTGSGHKMVNGYWDGTLARTPVIGTFEKAITGTNSILTLHGVMTVSPSTAMFDCIIYGTMDSKSKPKWAGTGYYTCTGMATPIELALTPVKCSTITSSATEAESTASADPNAP